VVAAEAQESAAPAVVAAEEAAATEAQEEAPAEAGLVDIASILGACRKSTDLSWEGDEPSTAVAEEEATPPGEESAPAPQEEPEAPAAEAALPEARMVEGEYSAETTVPRRVVVVVE
jgi:hypothetical protein